MVNNNKKLEMNIHERLLSLDLQVHEVTGDGNCQFRAIEFQLKDTPINYNYKELRNIAVKYVERHPEKFEKFIVKNSIDSYVSKMKENGTWGDQLTLQALSNKLNLIINIFSHKSKDWDVVVIPNRNVTRSTKKISITHIPEFHYNSTIKITNAFESFSKVSDVSVLASQENKISKEQINSKTDILTKKIVLFGSIIVVIFSLIYKFAIINK